jgi:uncharacterized protein (TIGR02611 family)
VVTASHVRCARSSRGGRQDEGDGALNGDRTHRTRERDPEPGLVDEIAERLGLRDRMRAHPALGPAYRLVVGLVGVAVIALGIVLLPLPGPGWLVVFLGLGILATEFAWAERLLDYAKDRVRAWTRWLGRQRLVVKGLVGVGTMSIVAGAVAAYLAWQGMPGWLPIG